MVGNWSRGEDRYNSVLTAEDVVLIRQLLVERDRLLTEARKLTNAAIGEKFGVHPNTVWKLGKYGSWAHVHGM